MSFISIFENAVLKEQLSNNAKNTFKNFSIKVNYTKKCNIRNTYGIITPKLQDDYLTNSLITTNKIKYSKENIEQEQDLTNENTTNKTSSNKIVLNTNQIQNQIYTNKKTIADDEAISSTQTKKNIIDSFMSIMSVMDAMVVLLALASVILGIVVLYNLGILSYMERYRELATLKVLGFKDRKITSLLVTQNMWMTLFGMILGAPLGVWVLKALMDLLASDYDIKLKLDPRMFIYSFVLVLLTSLFVSFMVARKNKYINMVEALKAE